MKLHKALAVFVFSSLFLITSCNIDGEENIAWRPGESLIIQGSPEVSVKVDESYYVEGFTVEENYTWTLNGDPVEATREGEFVNLNLPEPGDYTLVVNNGTHTDSLIITASPVEVSFSGNAATDSEATDTLMIPVTISSAITSATTVTYTVGGTAIAGEDYQLVSPNPFVIPAGVDEAAIKFAVTNDMIRENPAETLTVTLNAVSAEGTNAGVVLPDSVPLRTYTLTLDDDVKYVAFANTQTDTLTDMTAVGVHTFDVVLSEASDADVTVAYTVTGSGVQDLTGGEITLAAGNTTEPIVIELEENALAVDQTIEITLDTPDSEDQELMFEMDETGNAVGTVKTIVVNVP